MGFGVWVWGLGFGFGVWVWGLEFGFGVWGFKGSLFGAPHWLKVGHSRSGFGVWGCGLGIGSRGLRFGVWVSTVFWVYEQLSETEMALALLQRNCTLWSLAHGTAS